MDIYKYRLAQNKILDFNAISLEKSMFYERCLRRVAHWLMIIVTYKLDNRPGDFYGIQSTRAVSCFNVLCCHGIRYKTFGQ